MTTIGYTSDPMFEAVLVLEFQHRGDQSQWQRDRQDDDDNQLFIKGKALA